MEQRLQEYKTRKKACKREKRRFVTLWKTLTLTFGLLAILLSLVAPLSYLWDNAVAQYLGGSFFTLENKTVTSYEYNTDAPPAEEDIPLGMPTLGAQNGLRLCDVVGLAYDDPMWEDLLDQLTYEDLLTICLDDYGWRLPVASIHAPGAPAPEQTDGGFCFRACCFARHETDPEVVNKLRISAHRELYDRANSSLMDGIGPETNVKVQMLLWVHIFHWAAAGLWGLTLIFVIFWIRGKKKWKRTPAYLDYKTIRNVLKMEKDPIA